MINVISTHPNGMILEIIREFAQQNDQAQIQLENLNAKELEERTIKGEIDVSFGYFYHHVDTLTYKDIFEETLNLFCGRDNKLFNTPDEDITEETLEGMPYVAAGHYEESAVTEAMALPVWKTGARLTTATSGQATGLSLT